MFKGSSILINIHFQKYVSDISTAILLWNDLGRLKTINGTWFKLDDLMNTISQDVCSANLGGNALFLHYVCVKL